MSGVTRWRFAFPGLGWGRERASRIWPQETANKYIVTPDAEPESENRLGDALEAALTWFQEHALKILNLRVHCTLNVSACFISSRNHALYLTSYTIH